MVLKDTIEDPPVTFGPPSPPPPLLQLVPVQSLSHNGSEKKNENNHHVQQIKKCLSTKFKKKTGLSPYNHTHVTYILVRYISGLVNLFQLIKAAGWSSG